MSEGAVPSWVEGWDADQWGAFKDVVQAGIDRHQCAARWEDAVGIILVDHPRFGRVQLGLGNLVHSLRQAPQAQWRQHVAHWLRVSFAARPDDIDWSDFGTVRPLLRIRLWPEASVGTDVSAVTVPVMPGIVAMLCVDLPDRALSVQPERLEAWELSVEEAMNLAMRQTLEEPATSDTLHLPEGPVIYAMESDGLYVTTRALVLQRWVEARHGALVAIPNRHLVLFHPIQDAGAVVALYALHAMAEGAYAEGPGSLSPSVFWWQPGRYTVVGVEEQDGEVRLRVPAELAAVLAEVAGPEDA